ncbi:uncharacterized protein STEHIDRAFT_129415 [Stereum hirsutum FP-91666 SS1]|uniref:uncharacterized protein n=1 Tax=Stereum hirsutum (strain FP-91666) TaxID=721885 RepID=UPI000440BC3D|nr:uncharacterized protein STEHIDRAFT_129415 [Stereum hirsutum FP-91666 SS1]EIM88773.1 hypothetical protein STEHIDRAFT_129415 [Stereum hirsutum FP-91666 SS1]
MRLSHPLLATLSLLLAVNAAPAAEGEASADGSAAAASPTSVVANGTTSWPVITATRLMNSLISESPYFVTVTTVMTWTQSPTATPSASGSA